MNKPHPNPPDDAQHLQALLEHRDCPCTHCGYNLRGLSSDACPECGKPVDVTALLNRPPRLDPAWLIMLLSFAAALPWSLLFVWQRLAMRGKLHYGDDWNPTLNSYGRGLFERPWDEALRMLASCVWWLSVPVVIVALIALRKKISRWPGWVRWALACVCVLMLILAFRRWQWWWYAMGFNGSQYADWPMWYFN